MKTQENEVISKIYRAGWQGENFRPRDTDLQPMVL